MLLSANPRYARFQITQIPYTNKGNLIYRPIHEVIESRWKDTGEHLSQTVALGNDEYVLNTFVFESIDQDAKFL